MVLSAPNFLNRRYPIGNDVVVQAKMRRGIGVAEVRASASVSLVDMGGRPVQGQAWPVQMTHVGGGCYQCVLSGRLRLRDGQRFLICQSVTGSRGEMYRSVRRMVAVEREIL